MRRGGEKGVSSEPSRSRNVADSDDDDQEDEEEVMERRGSNRKRGRSSFRNDAASRFIDIEAEVGSDEDEEEEDGEDDGFIVDDQNPNDEDYGGGRVNRRALLPQEDDEEENIEDFERKIQERYSKFHDMHTEFEEDDEINEIDQQALLPCVRDPKLWMVKCAIGHERELAVCLMKKIVDRKPNQLHIIKSAIALDNLKNFIYIEAEKEAHVREACKGLRFVISGKITLVPIKEMTGVVSVEGKEIGVSRGSWVRMKRIRMYEGDLGKVEDVDNVRGRVRVRVKLVPRIDLQALARKLEGRESKKNLFVPPARLMNISEARGLGIRVEWRRDPVTGDWFEKIGDMLFKDGFLYKTVAMTSISWHNINPTLSELEKFSGDGEDDVFSINRKKGGFVKGDAVVVVKGDLRNLVGRVEKVEEESVHVRPEIEGLRETLVINRKELCKFFKVGDHVKVISGSLDGATGMVVNVDDQQHELITILSDKNKQPIHVFADYVAKSTSSGTNGEDGNSISGSSHSRIGRYSGQRRFSRGGKGHDASGLGAGTRVKIRQGPYKGYRGRVVEVKGSSLLVELESQMKIVSIDRQSCGADSDNLGAVASCATPLHPYMLTPMRDPRATPIHDGMRTPVIH